MGKNAGRIIAEKERRATEKFRLNNVRNNGENQTSLN